MDLNSSSKINSAQKYNLYQKWLKGRNDTLWNQYKTYRNKLTHIKELAKKSYFQKTISKSKNDIKTLWKNVNSVIKSHIKRKQIPDEISNNTETVTGTDNINNLFNKYFTSIGPKLASKLNFDKSNIAMDGQVNAKR